MTNGKSNWNLDAELESIQYEADDVWLTQHSFVYRHNTGFMIAGSATVVIGLIGILVIAPVYAPGSKPAVASAFGAMVAIGILTFLFTVARSRIEPSWRTAVRVGVYTIGCVTALVLLWALVGRLIGLTA